MAETTSATRTEDQAAEAQQPPRPDPALRELDRYVGTWENVPGTDDSLS